MNDEEWTSIHMAAREEAQNVVKEHLDFCPFSRLNIEGRLRTQETRFSLLIGFMLGSGLLGGAAGAAIFKALGG
jgi:hypothetical protein